MIPMRTLAAAAFAIALVAPALEADSSHGVLSIGAEVTAHCSVAAPNSLSAPASILCSKNAAGTVSASVDGRAPSLIELRDAGQSAVGAGVPLTAHPSTGTVRVLTVQF